MLVDLGCFWSELKITLRQQQIYTKFLALRGKSNVFFFFFIVCPPLWALNKCLLND